MVALKINGEVKQFNLEIDKLKSFQIFLEEKDTDFAHVLFKSLRGF